MAHIEKRRRKRPDGTYGPVNYRVRWSDPDGDEKSQTFKLGELEGAKDRMAEVEHSTRAGTYIDPTAGRETFRDYAEKWRQVQPHREGTAINVEQDLRLHLYPTLGRRPMAAVRQSEVQALVTKLAQQLAPSTVERVRGRVTAVFRAAVRDRVIAVSPCVDVRVPRSRSSSAVSQVLTTEQVLELADAMPRRRRSDALGRYHALVIAGAGLGLRPGELFGLALDRVDFLRRTVRVDQQLVRYRGRGVHLADLKTEASYRTVPLPAVVAEALAVHLATWLATNELGLIFTNERDAPVQQHPFAMVWATARAAAGLPAWATPHDLRHYFASLLIHAGASVKVVQQRLGHSSAKVTLDVYAHLWPDDEDRTRQAVDDELGPSRPVSTEMTS